MQSSTDNWKENEYMAFLLIYASKADAHTTDDEVKFIVSHFGQEAYNNVTGLFNKQSDYENLQTILAAKERFYPGETGKKAIREHLIGLFHADGNFSPMEKTVMSSLERLFG